MPQVSFRKGTVSPLDGVSSIQFGAAWDGKTRKQSRFGLKLAAKTGGRIKLGGGTQEVDLDLAVVGYRDGEPKRLVIGHNRDCIAGISHSGDNQTGEGSGDDEVVTVHLDRVPMAFTELAVVVTAFKLGTTFDNAQNVSLNVYDASGASAVLLDELMPTLGAGSNAVVVATMSRNLNASGDPVDGWTTTLVDKAGRMRGQGEDSYVLDFVRNNGGITARR